MLKIKFNKELFDLHIEEISKSITKLILKKLKSNLCIYEKECLVYVKDNLKSILKADNNQMKIYIEHFKNNFPKAIGNFNTEEKRWKRRCFCLA